MKPGDIFTNTFHVNSDVYQGFIQTFNDQNPLHTNKEFAAGKGFPEVVMHGNILNGFLSYFIGEMLPTKDVMIVSQNIDFKKPVFLNDTLSFKAEIVDFHESVSLIDFRFDFTNVKGRKVAKGNIKIVVLK